MVKLYLDPIKFSEATGVAASDTKAFNSGFEFQTIYSDQYLNILQRFFYWALSKVKRYRRVRRLSDLAGKYPRTRSEPHSDTGYRVVVGPLKSNGLCRAYQYELERLKSNGLYNPKSRNILILSQPRHYAKLFKYQHVNLVDTYNIGLWVTEFDVMSPDLRHAIKLVNEIWTPSEFSATAFKHAGVPVKIVPHAVRVGPGVPLDRKLFGISETAFLGIAIMDLGTCPDRKNPFAHILAWKRTFGRNQGSILLMKIRLGRDTLFLRRALLELIGDHENIKIVEDEFDNDTMTAFQRMADVYISLHRSEGYGLNVHEMLELGKPCVVTAYSGNMTYIKNYPNAYSVPFRLSPYRDFTFHYDGKNLRWAEADLNAASEILSSIYIKERQQDPFQ